MKAEDRIKHIQDVVMEEARTQGNEIISKHQEALDEIFETHREEAMRQQKSRIQAEQHAAKREVKTAISKRQLSLKRELNKVKTELKAELFEEVRALLLEYMNTEAYKELLFSYVEEAAKYADGQPMSIFIAPGDQDKKEYLEKRTGLTFTLSEDDFIGGIKAVLPSKNILMDHSFLSSMEKMEEEFTLEGGGANA